MIQAEVQHHGAGQVLPQLEEEDVRVQGRPRWFGRVVLQAFESRKRDLREEEEVRQQGEGQVSHVPEARREHLMGGIQPLPRSPSLP